MDGAENIEIYHQCQKCFIHERFSSTGESFVELDGKLKIHIEN